MTDRLGYYRVGDLKFHSKLEAIEMHAKTGIHPHWDFNEAVFVSYDWRTEPQASILELYRQRAQQLRDKYDYIVLIYSGGADSETVLQSFIDNDIKLDEVASYVNYSATGDRNNTLNGEIFDNAIPRIKAIPGLPHRIIDLKDLQLEYFTNATDWIYGTNTFFNSNVIAREGLALKIPQWRQLIEQGKRVCLLWGLDKPRVLHINNKFVVRFIDIVDNGPTVKSMTGELPYSDEIFYWTPDLPQIVIKQGHLIKNHLDNYTFKSPWISEQKSDLAYKVVDGKHYWLSNHGLHSIIYPNYRIGTLSAPKPGSTVFSPRDVWFNTMTQRTELDAWKKGVDHLWRTIPDYWKNNPGDVGSGLKACWSRDYHLE
jgi:hypothetical protein